MNEKLEKEMNECHSWILPKGTLIHYEGIPYRLGMDTDVFGNTPIQPDMTYPSDDEIKKFFKDL